MANVKLNWLTSGMSGRADKTSNIYTKQNLQTGQTYAVALRNPRTYEKQGAKEIQAQNKFHALSKGVAIFYNRISAVDASAEDTALLKDIVRTLRSKRRYSTVRGYLMARCAEVSADLTKVTITFGEHQEEIPVVFQARPLIEGNEDPAFNGGSSSSSGSSQGGSSSSNVTISLNAVGNGKVSIDGGTAGVSKSKSVAPGTQVAILATPDSGATFTQWSDGNTEASRNVTVNAAMSLTATFSGGNAGGDGPSEG